MRKAASIALGIAVGGTIACLVVHRRVIAAVLKGDPIPEPPEWHKAWHPCLK